MPIDKAFRRFHSSIVSSRQVATEISSLVSGSNAEQSERSSAASLTSKRPIRKRVNNAERKEMLECFVNKYRAMNMGKFPSPTSAKKEVGGGYYSIKKMLQEMEYNFKMSPGSQQKSDGPIDLTKKNKKKINGDDAVNQEIAMEPSGSQEKSNGSIDPTKENNKQIKDDNAVSQEIAMEPSGSQEKSNGPVDPIKENKKQIEGGDALNKEVTMESSGSQEKLNGPIDQNICEDTWLETGSNFDKNTDDTGNSNITENDTHDFATENDEKLGQKTRDDNFAFKDSYSKVEKQSDGTRGDKGEKENELREKSSLWGNLKSLANGFISMWKK